MFIGYHTDSTESYRTLRSSNGADGTLHVIPMPGLNAPVAVVNSPLGLFYQ